MHTVQPTINNTYLVVFYDGVFFTEFVEYTDYENAVNEAEKQNELL